MQDIRKVKNMESLISYFVDKLDWDIDLDYLDDIDDITYDFDAHDLGLKEEAFVKIKSLKQFRPFVDNQKWGIFFVEFDSKKFEVSALRKILAGLIPTKRNSSNHAVWDKEDLLFICTWGEESALTLGAVHFEENDNGLTQIKMFSCEPSIEDFVQVNVFEQRLSKLRWPQNINDSSSWKEEWSKAFTTRYKQTINDSKTLTENLAAEAKNIKNRVLDTLNIETKNGYVHLLYEKFKNTLIHDMSEKEFADMYAQTVVYGLFSARCMDNTQEDFSAQEAIDCMPNTNPFLKGLLRECLENNKSKNGISFDELEINGVVELLKNTNTDLIIEDFGRQTGGGKEDPVIHFYEEFLTAYDKTQKVQRGVFYTPQPVVDFMVRSVDELLKSKFGLVDGLASTETKTIKVKRDSLRKINGFIREVEVEQQVPAIQVLDPATGTGTFIRQVILQIYHNFLQKKSGDSIDKIKEDWNNYVSDHLLPRLNGFELMMAPYAVAHMKLAMILKDTGYDFKKNARLNVYLTNSLEEPGNSDLQSTIFEDPLAIESIQANSTKKNTGINIVIGNPPYSGESANKGAWIMKLMDDYKKEPGGLERLKERNPKWINDDYVKFIRYASNVLKNTENGIVAFINPHGFIDNHTFRGMRWRLLQDYDEIFIIDLHGNANKNEKCPDGSKDENVFDIKQGVSINIFVKYSHNSKKLAKVYHCDVYGSRAYKYDFLNKKDLSSLTFENVKLQAPNYFFVPQNNEFFDDYLKGFSVDEAFSIGSVGIVSAKDKVLINKNKDELLKNVSENYNIDVNSEKVKEIYYRPYDKRFIYYDTSLLERSREKVMNNFFDLGEYNNFGICVTKVIKNGNVYRHAFLCDNIIDSCYVSNKTSEITYVYPLFAKNSGSIISNLTKEILNKFNQYINPKEQDNISLSIFDYIYGYLRNEEYVSKYNDCLLKEFPRIPFPKNHMEFVLISEYGKKLRENQFSEIKNYRLNSLEHLIGQIVEKATFKNGRIVFNKHDSYINDIDSVVWNYQIGCYLPLQKWFKDNKGKMISSDMLCELCEMIEKIENELYIINEFKNEHKNITH